MNEKGWQITRTLHQNSTFKLHSETLGADFGINVEFSFHHLKFWFLVFKHTKHVFKSIIKGFSLTWSKKICLILKFWRKVENFLAVSSMHRAPTQRATRPPMRRASVILHWKILLYAPRVLQCTARWSNTQFGFSNTVFLSNWFLNVSSWLLDVFGMQMNCWTPDISCMAWTSIFDLANSLSTFADFDTFTFNFVLGSHFDFWLHNESHGYFCRDGWRWIQKMMTRAAPEKSDHWKTWKIYIALITKNEFEDFLQNKVLKKSHDQRLRWWNFDENLSWNLPHASAGIIRRFANWIDKPQT